MHNLLVVPISREEKIRIEELYCSSLLRENRSTKPVDSTKIPFARGFATALLNDTR